MQLDVARDVVRVREIHPRLDFELLGRIADQALERLVDRHVAAPLVGNRHPEPRAVEDRPELVVGQSALRTTAQPRESRVEQTTHRHSIPHSLRRRPPLGTAMPCTYHTARVGGLVSASTAVAESAVRAAETDGAVDRYAHGSTS